MLVLDSAVEITMADEKFSLAAGETIVMPADVPHAVLAAENMQFVLAVMFQASH
ncbi:MAG: hypothetical protein DDT37_01383 [Firmicutes bacterium]|nr:hypothetical protein [candidate division NPL-UPA2 bacterium]